MAGVSAAAMAAGSKARPSPQGEARGPAATNGVRVSGIAGRRRAGLVLAAYRCSRVGQATTNSPAQRHINGTANRQLGYSVNAAW
jgi:hypothetical protein